MNNKKVKFINEIQVAICVHYKKIDEKLILILKEQKRTKVIGKRIESRLNSLEEFVEEVAIKLQLKFELV